MTRFRKFKVQKVQGSRSSRVQGLRSSKFKVKGFKVGLRERGSE